MFPPDLIHAICNEAARQISIGDSGQAIILLREILNVDSSFTVAMENLMAAYYNSGVELYNKQRYSEALPLLNKSIDLASRVGAVSQLNAMRAVQHNCTLATVPSIQLPQSGSSSNNYSGRSLVRGRH